MSLRELGIFLKGQFFYQDRVGDNEHLIADDFFGVNIQYFGVLKRYDGANWVKCDLKQFNGATWVPTVLKRWDGTQWLLIDTSG